MATQELPHLGQILQGYFNRRVAPAAGFPRTSRRQAQARRSGSTQSPPLDLYRAGGTATAERVLTAANISSERLDRVYISRGALLRVRHTVMDHIDRLERLLNSAGELDLIGSFTPPSRADRGLTTSPPGLWCRIGRLNRQTKDIAREALHAGQTTAELLAIHISSSTREPRGPLASAHRRACWPHPRPRAALPPQLSSSRSSSASLVILTFFSSIVACACRSLSAPNVPCAARPINLRGGVALRQFPGLIGFAILEDIFLGDRQVLPVIGIAGFSEVASFSSLTFAAGSPSNDASSMRFGP